MHVDELDVHGECVMLWVAAMYTASGYDDRA